MLCPVCALESTDAVRFKLVQEALVTLPTTEVARVFGFKDKALRTHLDHSHVVATARRHHANQAKAPPPRRRRDKGWQATGATMAARSPLEPPRRPGGHHQTSATRLTGIALQQKAWDLRVLSLSYWQIAEQLDLRLSSGEPDAKAAHRLITGAIDRNGRVMGAAISEHREVVGARLEAVVAAFMPRATQAQVVVVQENGPTTIHVDTEAQDRAALVVLKALADLRKLLGIDAGAKRDTNASAGLGSLGRNDLPPALSSLDPPATVEELEHYVRTGQVPHRGAPVVERSYVAARGLPPPASWTPEPPPAAAEHEEGTQGAEEAPPPASAPRPAPITPGAPPSPPGRAPEPLPPPTPLDEAPVFPWSKGTGT